MDHHNRVMHGHGYKQPKVKDVEMNKGFISLPCTCYSCVLIQTVVQILCLVDGVLARSKLRECRERAHLP